MAAHTASAMKMYDISSKDANPTSSTHSHNVQIFHLGLSGSLALGSKYCRFIQVLSHTHPLEFRHGSKLVNYKPISWTIRHLTM